MSEKSEIEALLNLLADTDKRVVETVTNALLKKGEHIIPDLESAWEKSLNETFQTRIEDLVHNIQFNSLNQAITAWVNESEHDLLTGAYLIAKYAFPELRPVDIEEKLQKIIVDAHASRVEHGTPLEQIKSLNHVLFGVHGLTQNSNNFYAPQNSFLNIVLDQRRGNPISLSIIYMLVGRAIGLPLYGVNLPKNFIIVYGHDNLQKSMMQENLKFYINPYNRGAVLSAKEIEFFAKQQKLPHREEYYLPCSVPVIIRRILQNLIFSYRQLKQEGKMHDFEKLKKIFDNYLENKGGLSENFS